VASQWTGNARDEVFSGCRDFVARFGGTPQYAHGNTPPAAKAPTTSPGSTGSEHECDNPNSPACLGEKAAGG
jgi:hypothetical protein